MAKVMFSMYKLDATYIEIPRQVTDFRTVRIAEAVFSSGWELVCNMSLDGIFGGYATTKNTTTGCTTSYLYPITNLDRETARECAHNANTNLMCYDYYKWLFYWAFVIEYATLQSNKPVNNELDENGFHQGGLGGGLTKLVEKNGIFLQDKTGKDKCRYIGVTNELGNGTGELDIPTDTNNSKTGHPNRYRGFECPFGDIYLVLDGFLGMQVVNTEDDSALYYDYYSCNNPEYFADSIKIPFDVDDYTTEEADKWTKIARYGNLNTSDVYVAEEGDGVPNYTLKYAIIGNAGELLPQAWSMQTGKYYINPFMVRDKDDTDSAMLVVGSVAEQTVYEEVGLGYFSAQYSVSSTSHTFGFRCFNIIKDDGTVI